VRHLHQPRIINSPSRATLSHALRNFLLVTCGSALLATSAFANPAEEISRAVAANGAADVSKAPPVQFMKAFAAVAFRVQPRDLPDYVIAAVNLRPDLTQNIVAVAVKAAVNNWEAKPEVLCVMIERIVRAAIAANPDAAVSIARAGASAAPTLRRCVISAAIAAAPQAKDEILAVASAKTQSFAFLVFSSAGSAIVNPANISEVGDAAVTSPEQPPSH
jgi:hypothetical protein